MIKLSKKLWAFGNRKFFAKFDDPLFPPKMRLFSYLRADGREATARNLEIYLERQNGPGELF
jgi:hypothetical protein